MSFDFTPRLATAPVDHNGAERVARLHQFGIGSDFPSARFDDFARRIAAAVSAPVGVVNFIGAQQQYFAGMFSTPDLSQPNAEQPEQSSSDSDAERVVPRDHGYCPHVIARGKALVLEDVCDYPRFYGDIVVDDLGLRSYLGAPLIDHDGVPLGTVCAIDSEPHAWGRPGLHAIKSIAEEMMETLRKYQMRQPSSILR